MKKLLSLFLSFVLLVTALTCGSGFAFAEEADGSDDVEICLEHSNVEEKTLASFDKDGICVVSCEKCGNIDSSRVIYAASDISLSANQYVYNGNPKRPSVTVKNYVNEKLTTENYSLVYPSSPVNAGVYSVTVNLKNDYEGSKRFSYKILPAVSINNNTLAVGEKATVSAKGGSKYTYRSTNTSIAVVSSKGVVTAKKAGTAYIYVKTANVENRVKVTVKNAGITIPSTATIGIKTSKTLSKTCYPKSAKVSWSSSNKKVATVTSSGKVTGIKKGTAVITAKITYNGKTYKDTCKVTVKNPTLSITKKTLYNSQSLQLEVIGGSGKITYTSSNKAVATVSSSGKVRAIKSGKCVITAKRNGYSSKCEITVSPNNVDFKAIPDLGAMVGVTRQEREYEQGVGAYAYNRAKVEAKDKKWKTNYVNKLKAKGFEYFGRTNYAGITVYVYANENYIVMYYYYEDLIVVGMTKM